MMKYLQKLGKSLMLPVAVLPAAGILMGIGYWIDPTGWGANSAIAAFLIKAGGAIIDNMAILFAIGVAVGMADDHEGTAGLAGLVSWLMIQTILSTGVVAMLKGIDAGEVNAALVRSTTSLSVSYPVSSVPPAITGLKTRSFRTRWHSSAASVLLRS